MRKQLKVSEARAELKAQLDAGLISMDEYRRANYKISEVQSATEQYGNKLSWQRKRELYAIWAGHRE